MIVGPLLMMYLIGAVITVIVMCVFDNSAPLQDVDLMEAAFIIAMWPLFAVVCCIGLFAQLFERIGPSKRE